LAEEREHETLSELTTTPRSLGDAQTAILPRTERPTVAEQPAAGSPSQATPVATPTMLSDEEVQARLEARDRIGRFICLRRIGEGGMGIVSLAYDEELDRKLALKVIRQGFCEQPEHRRRFIREAQALARLSHPNVVTIYEVGEHLGRPYLAMEFVEGRDLRAWVRERRRSPREILAVFVDAGRGLAAAHAAGLVHRDFKPGNVLVGVDGRARVLDFGISRAADAYEGPASGVLADTERGSVGDTLTAVGTIMGTPAYMSPEQLRGASVDGRTDQYAFAVALYEALVGERPFAGRGVVDRFKEGFEFTCPADSPLPKRLQRAITRALAAAPEQRFPSMDALLAALTADPWRGWRRAGASLAIVGVAAGLGFGLISRPEPCTGAAAQIAGAWSADSRSAVTAALAQEGAAGAGVGLLTEFLDGYTRGWATTHREACLAHVRGESSAEALDLRMRCLQRARAGLEALVAALRGGGPDDLDDALVDAHNLPAVRGCLDLDALSSGPPPPPPAIAEEVEALRVQLAAAALTVRRADAEAAREAAAAAVERARTLGYRPLVGEALHTLGRLESELADYEAAAQALEEALWVTVSVDDPARSAEVISSLIYVLGGSLDRDEAASRWRAHADALAGRLGADSAGAARLAWAIGAVALHHGRAEEAVRELRRAVAISEELHGPEHVTVASHLGNLGAALGTARDFEGAKEAFERSLRILEAAYGAEHSSVITTLGNLANVHMLLGDVARALTLSEEALARALRVRGGDHPQVATLLQNLARARRTRGQWAEARADLLRAAAIQRRRLGAHRELMWTLSELVLIEVELAALAAAKEHAAELVEVTLAVLPEDAPKVLRSFGDAAEVAAAQGDVAAVISLAERGLARPLERAAREDPESLAYLRFLLAQALHQRGRAGDRRRALALAEAAQPVFAADPAAWEEELALLATWSRRRAGR
jgi:tetratricopeptide (TPR) repeat protein/predicted Ser/Thr protein kinase